MTLINRTFREATSLGPLQASFSSVSALFRGRLERVDLKLKFKPQIHLEANEPFVFKGSSINLMNCFNP